MSGDYQLRTKELTDYFNKALSLKQSFLDSTGSIMVCGYGLDNLLSPPQFFKSELSLLEQVDSVTSRFSGDVIVYFGAADEKKRVCPADFLKARVCEEFVFRFVGQCGRKEAVDILCDNGVSKSKLDALLDRSRTP